MGRRSTWAVIVSIALLSSMADTEGTAAEPDQRALVVVSTPSQADYVHRIGGQHVQVEQIFTNHKYSYRECEKRVQRLLAFRVLMVPSNEPGPSMGFWHERMVRANPKGSICHLPKNERWSASEIERSIKQMGDIHRALVLTLPQFREAFDANLRIELLRLKQGQWGKHRVAMRD
ncbi:MAG: hypothetical protein AAF497_19390 [Planctomycetota bacterium]